MKGLNTTKKNYKSGNRPRRFFGNTKQLLDFRIMTSNGGLKYDPNWRGEKVA